MAERDSWQVSSEAATVYERDFVPALFGQWPPVVAEVAQVSRGDRALDVGCGTGVLARELARRVGTEGRTVGLDPNEGMLAEARRRAPEVEWREGVARALPFEDGSFDAVVSQFALMFVPDPAAALSEMWRVTAPGGRLAVAVWAPFEHATAYVELAETAHRRAGERAAAVFRAPFVFGPDDELRDLGREAGIENASIDVHEGWARFESIDEYVRIEVEGSPLAEMLNADEYRALVNEARAHLAAFADESGRLALPMNARVLSAHRADHETGIVNRR